MANPTDNKDRKGQPQQSAQGGSAETTAVDAAKKKPTNGASSTSTPKKTAQEVLDEQKYQIGSTSEYNTGVFMNVDYAKLDDDITDTYSFTTKTNSGVEYRILSYFAPKYVIDTKKRFSTNNLDSLAFRLTYKNDIQSIVLEDRLDCIGMYGYIQVKSMSGYLDMILERHNNYFLVINISRVDGGSQDGSDRVLTRFEPYIFDISYVEQLSAPDSQERRMRIHFVDCMTAILRTHSIASVIKFNRTIVDSQSYKDVFSIILDYIKCYLKVNSNNTIDFKKDLLYGSNVLFGGNKLNGNDEGNVMTDLIKNSFGKINRRATIYEAMVQLMQDCVTTLKVPNMFAEQFESIGDVLIPFFFKEEYPDKYRMYPSSWIDSEYINKALGKKPKKKNDKPTTTPPPPTTTTPTTPENPTTTPTTTPVAPAAPATRAARTTGNNAPKTNKTLLQQKAEKARNANVNSANNKKPKTGDDASSDASSDDTTDTEDGNASKANISQIFSNIFYSSPTNTTYSVVMRQMTMRDFYMPFLLCFGDDEYTMVWDVINPSPNETNLIPLNSSYQHKPINDLQFDPIDMSTVRKIWKNVVFVDCADGGSGGNSTMIFFNWFYEYFSQVFLNSLKKGYVSNIIPDFYTVSRNEKIGNAAEEGSTFHALFDEYNSYVIPLETTDTVKECLRYMGKNISSFVLLNDMYSFTLDGDIMRRPNEIVKLGSQGSNFNLADNFASHMLGAMDQAVSMLPLHTDLIGSNSIYAYVKQVTHKFEGNNYTNVMYCCKVCEYAPDSKPYTPIRKVKERTEQTPAKPTTDTTTPTAPAKPTTTGEYEEATDVASSGITLDGQGNG